MKVLDLERISLWRSYSVPCPAYYLRKDPASLALMVLPEDKSDM